jgi:myo-inositol-1(or 4)-monophosphatase
MSTSSRSGDPIFSGDKELMLTNQLKPIELQTVCNLILSVITEAGCYANKARNDGLDVKYDTNGSPTTNADTAVSQFIQNRLIDAGLGFKFSGEEIGFQCNPTEGFMAVIDGIDGTRNYRDGNYGWCISIGVLYSGVPVIGVVHDPYVGEMFYAIRNGGAFVQARNTLALPLCVPTVIPSDFSFSVGSYRVGGTSAKKQDVISGFKAIGGREREWGCVALSICAVAKGGLGAFVQANSFLHDHIAALLIAKEAGANTIEKDTAGQGRFDILVCHPSLIEKCRAIITGNW